MRTQRLVASFIALAGCALAACGSSSGGTPAPGSGAGATATGGTSALGGAGGTTALGGAGGTALGGAVGMGGVTALGGTAGIGGATALGGTAGIGGAGGEGGIGQDIPPWEVLTITVTPGQHTHTTPSGQTAGMDNRAAKMAGKLVVDMGVYAGTPGGYQPYLGKRGFHVIGITEVNDCTGIDDWTLGRDFDGDCRLNTLDGLPHGNQNTVTPQQSVMNQVLQALLTFKDQFPGEGWEYFLTQDLKAVRWSDVALTGLSHGAQNAACFAHELRVYRVVPQSGPRENTCGTGVATGPYDPASPPWDPNCPIAHIAAWLDAPSATPIDRYFGFTGGLDPQFGDIMFSMQRMSFVGDYVNIDAATAPYGGSHRFYSLAAGHSSFPNGFPIAAINVAFGVLPENENPTF